MCDVKSLWEEIYAAVWPHRMTATDTTPQAVLNRLAAKVLRTEQRRTFDPSTCLVRQELLSPEALRELQVYHDRKSPKRWDGPIIVLVCKGRRIVVDGNNRVNSWLQAGESHSRRAIIIDADTRSCH